LPLLSDDVVMAEFGDGAPGEGTGSEREESPDVFKVGSVRVGAVRAGRGEGSVVGDATSPGEVEDCPLIKRGGGRRAVRVFEENSRGEGAGEG